MAMLLFRGLQLCVSLTGLCFNIAGVRAWRRRADALRARNKFHGPERIIVVELYDQEILRSVLQSFMVLLGVVGVIFKTPDLPVECLAVFNTPETVALSVFYRAMFMLISGLLAAKSILGHMMRAALEDELNHDRFTPQTDRPRASGVDPNC